MNRLSGVPSFFTCVVAGAVFAASLLALYRMSAVPSFLVGPAAGLAVLDVVAAAAGLGALAFLGVVCAKVMPVKAMSRLAIRKSFFIISMFLMYLFNVYYVNLFKGRAAAKKIPGN